VRVADGPLEGEFISVPIRWASPIRLPNQRPTEQLVMFDPDAPAHVSSTAYYLLPERVRASPISSR
jgi:hypothetical protein